MKIPMFSFMRNRLSSKETVLSYFLYAIGELVLIALGILLALQLDNWNQKRLNGIRERVLLAEIQDEFIFNKEELVETARSYFKVRENCLKLVYLISEESVMPDEGLLSSLLKQISLTTSADLSKATIDTLKNTSSFHIIRNDELRSKLILWESEFQIFHLLIRLRYSRQLPQE